MLGLTPRPALGPLPSSRAELAATKPRHDKRIADADRLLRDFDRMDGAVRLVVIRPRQ